jgi:hypothetical protein
MKLLVWYIRSLIGKTERTVAVSSQADHDAWLKALLEELREPRDTGLLDVRVALRQTQTHPRVELARHYRA